VGTPVTATSFAIWRANKLQQRQANAEARVKAEQAKKKGGKGLCKTLFILSLIKIFLTFFVIFLVVIYCFIVHLCYSISLMSFILLFIYFAAVLSGKELFNYNAALFVDDDAALDAAEETEMNSAMVKQQQEEERRVEEETQRAQAEQQRLFEINQIEVEFRRHKEGERRLRAADSNRAEFVLLGVTINQVVFEEDEAEDLSPFPEETLVETSEEDGEKLQTVNEGDEEEEEEEEEEEDDDDDEEDEEDDEDDEEEDFDGNEEDDDELALEEYDGADKKIS
jgi:hypothetical protein